MSSAWPDVEGSLRDYLKADTAVRALVGNRVFFGFPPRTSFPLVIVRRISGGQDPGEAPVDRPLMQVDCWATKGDKAGAYNVAAAVRDALSAIARTTQGGAVLFGATVIGAAFLPDPDTDQPRYSLTVDLTARAVPVA